MRHPASSIALKETGRDPHKLKRYCVVDHTRGGDNALNLIDGVFQCNAETVNCGPATDPPILSEDVWNRVSDVAGMDRHHA